MMNLAKVTGQGQVTIPSDIRKYLGVKGGDKVVFMKEKGRVVIENSALLTLKEAQADFAGVAESLGLKDEQDVVAFIKEHRRSEVKTR
jgi:AbrB family looped-hinge helix DNA binding protein